MTKFEQNTFCQDEEEVFKRTWGFSQYSILKQIIECTSDVCEITKKPVQLIVKPHPLEKLEPLEQIINSEKRSSLMDCKIINSSRCAELIRSADLVLGTTSTALLESSLAGKHTLSVQIGTKNKYFEDNFYGNRIGITSPIYEKNELRKAISEFICRTKTKTQASKNYFHGSAHRIAEIIKKYSLEKC